MRILVDFHKVLDDFDDAFLHDYPSGVILITNTKSFYLMFCNINFRMKQVLMVLPQPIYFQIMVKDS